MRVLKISMLVLMVLFLAAGVSHAQTVKEYYDKGVEDGAQGKFEEAEKEFKKALEADQSYAPAKECLKLTEDALEKKVENEAAIHLFKGVAYGSKGMVDEEIAEYKKAIAINLLYCAACNKWMFDEAIAESQKAIAITPNLAKAHNNLGLAYGGGKGCLMKQSLSIIKPLPLTPTMPRRMLTLG